MKLFTDYLYQYTSQEMAYYEANGIDIKMLQFKYAPLIDDLLDKKITMNDALDTIKLLTDNQKEQLYKYAKSKLDIFDPQEELLDIMDLLDPEYTYE